MIPITWPFAVWGLDLVGPLKKVPRAYTHLLVTIDKFTKWIEAWPIMKIRSEEAIKFFTDIIHHFGVSNSIIKDIDTQFMGKKFLRFCDNNHIRVDWATVAHPRMNGQVERNNGMVLHGIKPRVFNKLNKCGEQWVTDIPVVHWSLRTTPNRAMGYTPFFMVYDTEAVLLTDLDYGAPRVVAYREPKAEEHLEDAMDQLDEPAMLPSLALPSTSRRYADTTINGSGVEPSVSVT
jgi:hypothetical protein